MLDLSFEVDGAEPVLYAATPSLSLNLRVRNSDPEERIHTVALRVQIQIEAARREYLPEEQFGLRDLFGEPDRWSRTLRTMPWMNLSVLVPAFQAAASTSLQIPCSFDFNLAATKYFHGVTQGEIPLHLLFSGTVFHATPDAELQVAPIAWDKETRFRLPVDTWRAMMDHYYPNSAWLNLRRDVFERAYQYKVRHGIATWEETLERLMDAERETMEAVLPA